MNKEEAVKILKNQRALWLYHNPPQSALKKALDIAIEILGEEVECPKCNGKGYIRHRLYKMYRVKNCCKCKGVGRIDKDLLDKSDKGGGSMIQKVEILVKADGEYMPVEFIDPRKVKEISESERPIGEVIQEIADGKL